jgi:hypothetical protein
MEIAQSNRITNLLVDAQNLSAVGNTGQAYSLALEATKIAPDYIDAWFWRATTAPSLEERLHCLSRVYALDPHFDPARPHLIRAMRDLLHEEPFLGYLGETDDLYRVKSGLEIYLNVPKSRAVFEPYPAKKPDVLRSTQRLLLLSGIGLLLGGIGAILIAPLAALNAMLVLARPVSQRDQGRALVAMIGAGLIWLAAFPISYLFILHITQ